MSGATLLLLLQNASNVATSYTLTGPSSGAVNVASANFSVLPNGVANTSVIPHTSGSGLFYPSMLSFANSSAAQAFQYTPYTTAGSPHTITTTASPPLGTDPAGILYTVTAPATQFTLTGPTSGPVNVASAAFTVTPDGTVSRVVTPASSGAGSFNPASLTWSSESTAKTFAYTPSSLAGSPHAISISASPFLPVVGSPINYTVLAVSDLIVGGYYSQVVASSDDFDDIEAAAAILLN
jgi:hypothetical protein